jgi:hypothetical protein
VVRRFFVLVGCRCWSSPASNPRNLAAEFATEIDHGRVEWLFGEGRPEFELVSFAVALMAMVTIDGHVHRKGLTAPGSRFVQGTRAVPLVTGTSGRLEAEQGQYLLHGDLGAKFVEVDARYGFSLCAARFI